MIDEAALDQPMYGVAQAAHLLHLRPDKVRRWLDGYTRDGTAYPPVVRDHHTGEDLVTWGEFVELGFLREYRKVRVSLQHIRPIVDWVKNELGTKYPLATARFYVGDKHLIMLKEQQDRLGLDPSVSVVVDSGQGVLELAGPPKAYLRKIEFDGGETARRLRPAGPESPVVIDPNRSFGMPRVRHVTTERIAELFAASESIETIARGYDLSPDEVQAALRFEWAA